LFNKIRSQFSDIKIGDENGALTDEEDKARFFDFNFKIGSEVLGRVNIKLDQKSLTVIYTADMLDNADVGKTNWFDFLKDLRRFARSNILNFDTRDITKSNLDKRDYKYLSKESGENKMSESRLFGTSKTSFQDMGEAKIIVRHSQPVNMENPAGRTQRIESIYIESGELDCSWCRNSSTNVAKLCIPRSTKNSEHISDKQYNLESHLWYRYGFFECG
jgi:hypothetical protein